jgi:hypothetical protein
MPRPNPKRSNPTARRRPAGQTKPPKRELLVRATAQLIYARGGSESAAEAGVPLGKVPLLQDKGRSRKGGRRAQVGATEGMAWPRRTCTIVPSTGSSVS